MLMLGKKLKEIRIQNCLSQDELAKKINVHRTIISKWENDCLLRSIENLHLMSKLYNISIDEMINNKYKNINKIKIILILLLLFIIKFIILFTFVI